MFDETREVFVLISERDFSHRISRVLGRSDIEAQLLQSRIEQLRESCDLVQAK